MKERLIERRYTDRLFLVYFCNVILSRLGDRPYYSFLIIMRFGSFNILIDACFLRTLIRSRGVTICGRQILAHCVDIFI